MRKVMLNWIQVGAEHIITAFGRRFVPRLRCEVLVFGHGRPSVVERLNDKPLLKGDT
jgi:hypothetical protein